MASTRRAAFTGEFITAPHLGLLSIASVLREGTFGDTRGCNVAVVDDQLCFLKDPSSMPGACLNGYKPDIIGGQAILSGIKNAINLLHLTRARFPGVLTVLGGIAPTQMDEELVQSGAVDVVIRGEGEQTFSELVQKYGDQGRSGLKTVTGITFKDEDGNTIKNPARVLIDNLDILPYPARNIIDINLYRRISPGRSGNLITSRGCTSTCAYCYSKYQWGVGQRRYSVERTIAEIRSMIENFKINRVRIEDDNFLEDKKWVLSFYEAIKKSGLHKEFEWEAKGRPEQIDEEIARKIREIGCFRVMIGVETFNDGLLKKLGRGVQADVVRRAINILHNAGIGIQPTVILGIPGESFESMRQTLDWLDNHLMGRDIIGPCFFMPFNRVSHEMANRFEYKIEIADIDCYTGHIPVTSSKECSYEDLWKLYEDMGSQRQGKYNHIGHLPSLEKIRKRMLEI